MATFDTSLSPIGASRSPVDTCCSPEGAGFALDGGKCSYFFISTLVDFYCHCCRVREHNNNRTLITPIATPATTKDWTEQHIQLKETETYEQGKRKTDPDWQENEED